MNVIFPSQYLLHLKILVFGEQDSKNRFKSGIYTRIKVIVWCAVHANGVVGTYDFNIETVGGVDFHLVMDRYA